MAFTQNNLKTDLVQKIKLNDDNLVQIDNFNNLYFIGENAVVKRTNTSEFIYNNMQLGDISSLNVFNPLKINLFYENFSTVLILDNRLSEVKKINFNTLTPFRNISHVSTGHDNTIWVFNQNSQQLELFDYRTNTTRVKTFPIKGNVIQITSNYNNCWVLTDSYIYQYNYFGSLISKLKNNAFESLVELNENLYLLKENTLYFKSKNSIEINAILLPKLLINRFFVTNESLYIYDDEFLHQYQLINE